MTTENLSRRAFLLRAAALLAALRTPGWAEKLAAAGVRSNFKAVYLDTPQRDRFYWFLQEVFHLYPEDRFHQLIWDLTKEKATDEEIYRALQAELPALKPLLGPLTYDLPALKKQKKDMADQALAFLGPNPVVDGYLEIGSPARYLAALKGRIRLMGKVYVLNDLAMSYSLPDMMERGGPAMPGTFLPMGDYDPIPASVPDGSIGLVANFIGFHHAPAGRLAGFVSSIKRVLKPGGRMLVRDHDVDSKKMDSLVALAHDVFNAGVKLAWEENAGQIRLFRSIRDWTAYLEAAGFKRSERLLAQDHDPTQNLLAEYVKL